MPSIVVATGPPLFEESLQDVVGDDLVALIPEQYAASRAGVAYPVVTLPRLNDLTAVAAVAARFPDASAVLAGQEECMVAAALLRDLLDVPGPRLAEAVRFTDKSVMKRRLAAAGLLVAANRRVRNLDDVSAVAGELGWPAVVKPPAGSGTQGVWMIRDERELAATRAAGLLDSLEAGGAGILVERYVPMLAELHCDGLTIDGKEVFAHVGRYHKPLLTSLGNATGITFLPDDHPDAIVVADLHRAALAALGITDGFSHGEYYLTPDGPVVGEVAARPGGGGLPRAVQLQYGIDVRAWSVDLALGRPLRPAASGLPGVLSWRALPAGPGRITRITLPEDLLAFPGVQEVSLRYRPGDVFDRPRGSTAYAGHVYLESATLEDAPADLARMLDAYEYHAEPLNQH